MLMPEKIPCVNRVLSNEIEGSLIGHYARLLPYPLDRLPTLCFRLIEACRVAYLSETIPEHIIGVLLRNIIVILISNHISRSHELTLLQVQQIDILCPLLQAFSQRHDHDIAQFIIGQISQLAIQFFDITSPQPNILRLREKTIVCSRKVIRPQILFKVVYPGGMRCWLPLCRLVQPGILTRQFLHNGYVQQRKNVTPLCKCQKLISDIYREVSLSPSHYKPP